MKTGILFKSKMEELTGVMDETKVSSDEMKAVIVKLSEQTGTPAEDIAEYAQSKIAEGWGTDGVYKLLKGLGVATEGKKTDAHKGCVLDENGDCGRCGGSHAEQWKDNIMRRFTRTN